MNQDYIIILGEEMPREMFNDFADMISSSIKGYKICSATLEFTCPICFGDGESVGEPVVITECNHTYHLKCIENWKSVKNNCPLCRNVLPTCTKSLVEELLLKLKEHIKLRILKGWWGKLDGLSQDEIGLVSQQMQSFVDNDGWTGSNFDIE